MAINAEFLKSNRQIIEGERFTAVSKKALLTAYLGIYNASQYIDSLLEQLQAQTLTDFPIVIVDNCSSDDSWQKINKWPAELLSKAKLIKNPINLGGTGSAALNVLEVQTPWLATLHQDDFYGKKHLEALHYEIAKEDAERFSVIFTDMGSMSFTGKRSLTGIRQSWIADLETNEGAFIANLIQQSVSYPSAAFKVRDLVDADIPWHSSSFPDTERTLLQTSTGKFKFVPERTMIYRMNPNSESHDLHPRERVLGPFASLCRVMASDSFIRLCSGIEPEKRKSFANRVLEGIETRLGSSELSEMVKLIAAESMAFSWDYSEPNSREQILRTYRLAQDGRTTKLLEDLIGLQTKFAETISHVSLAPLSSSVQVEIEKLLDQSLPPSNATSSFALRSLLTVVAGILPLKLRRRVVRLLARVYSKIQPKSVWNLSWNPKP